jgi:hypothetical protein
VPEISRKGVPVCNLMDFLLTVMRDDGVWCEQKGFDQGKKADWNHRPELARITDLFDAYSGLGLNFRESL